MRHEHSAVAAFTRYARTRSPAGSTEPTGLSFHRLKGTRGYTYAVSIGGNWRLTYKWDGEGAIEVNVEDYHD